MVNSSFQLKSTPRTTSSLSAKVAPRQPMGDVTNTQNSVCHTPQAKAKELSVCNTTSCYAVFIKIILSPFYKILAQNGHRLLTCQQNLSTSSVLYWAWCSCEMLVLGGWVMSTQKARAVGWALGSGPVLLSLCPSHTGVPLWTWAAYTTPSSDPKTIISGGLEWNGIRLCFLWWHVVEPYLQNGSWDQAYITRFQLIN